MIAIQGRDREGHAGRRPWLGGVLTATLACVAAAAQAQCVGERLHSGTFYTCVSTTSAATVSLGAGVPQGLAPFFTNPSIQAALARASAIHGPSALTLDQSVFSVTTSTTFGPATILVGPNQSQTVFIPGGDFAATVNTHTQNFFTISAAVGFLFGDFHAAFQTGLLDQSWSFLDALFAQLRGFGVNGAGPGARLNTQLAALGAIDAGGIGLAQLGPDGRLRPSPWYVWVRPFGTLGKVDGSDERLGFRYDIAGISAGSNIAGPGPGSPAARSATRIRP
jgi:hypothetical protein